MLIYSLINKPLVYSTDRSKAVVPVLVLLFVALWFILRGDLFYVLACVIFLLVFFRPFSIVITLLGEERANMSAFRTFVRSVLVWVDRFPLPLGVWERLRFVIVALPRPLTFYFYSTRLFVLCLILCYSSLVFFFVFFALRLPRLGKRELILMLFVRLFDLRLFGFVVLFVSFSSWCLARAAVCDCGTPWSFLLPVFHPLFLEFRS